ncbi:MAG: TonB-dependent receptor, partial [Prevotellaceae bacterium]|nr:TonB-dependent receptor [Prevotellaceae bacterium]
TYKLETEHHSLSIMAGNTLSKRKGSTVNASGSDLPASTIRVTNLSRDPKNAVGSGGFTNDVNMLSYYGRMVYSLNDQFILTGTVRRDGSSNFSSSNRWGTFPSAAVAWRIKDTFMENVDAINNLKIRAGWGQTGNAGNIAGKSIYALSSSNVWYNFYQKEGLGNGTPSSGYYAPLVDRNLKWETNEQVNLGLDLGFLDGDLEISADYFTRKTKDLLLNLAVRASSGNTEVYTNYGSMENKGIEFSVNYKKYLGNDFSLSATLTGSSISSKITDLPNHPIYNTASGGNYDDVAMGNIDGVAGDGSNTFQVDAGSYWTNHSVSQIGSAVGSYYGWRVDYLIKNEADLEKAKALGQTSARIGDYSFKDLNGDGHVDDSDREIIGDGIPKLNFGLNLNLNYKNWDFSVYSYGVLGQKILSYSAMRLSTITNTDDNTTPAILKSSFNAIDTDWTSQSNRDYNGTLPALMITDQQYSQRVSDAWVKCGDYFKISNIQIGYSLSDAALKTLHLQSARVYFAVQNLATISPYTQYGDPEVGHGANVYTGLDTGRYPMPRTFMVGANFAF